MKSGQGNHGLEPMKIVMRSFKKDDVLQLYRRGKMDGMMLRERATYSIVGSV